MGRKKKVHTERGEGTIFYNKTLKRYQGQIFLGKDRSGNRIRKSVYGKTIDEVREKLFGLRLKYEKQLDSDIAKTTFYQYEEQILKDKLALGEIQEQTFHRNMSTLNALYEINNLALQEIDKTIIKALIIRIVDQYAQKTINQIWSMLKECFDKALNQKIITDNPLEDFKKPQARKVENIVRALTETEQKRLIAILQTWKYRYSEQMLLSLLLGMRCGEINALTKDDIKEDKIIINKTISLGEHSKPFVNSSPKTEAGERTILIPKSVRPVSM